jgi:hypothetical protein
MNTEHIPLHLPLSLYQKLQSLAEVEHTDPVGMIEKLVTDADRYQNGLSEEQPLSNLIADLIGAIDSQAEPRFQTKNTPFGKSIATKLSRQGLKRP